MTSHSEGDRTAICALSQAREIANRYRLSDCDVSDFLNGLFIGQCIVASARMDADPIIVLAAKNEIRFLCNDYSRRRP